MPSFVTAADASLDAFLAVSAGSPYQAQLQDYLSSLVRQESTKPEWCVLGLEAGEPVARVALWTPAGQTVPTDTVLIETDWTEEGLSSGHAVLTRVHELASALGADALGHSVDSPPVAPQYQEHEEARVRLLEDSGYRLLRDGLRWRHSPSSTQRVRPERSLAFRSSSEVGEEGFVAAIAATYAGTRDSWLSQNIAEHGLLEAARADFLDAQALDYAPDWWELAYTEDGELAGVIMAAKSPSTAVVYYVGVVPEQRGRGLATQLVRRGTERLVDSGAEEIRGDCDRDNLGIVKAFERAGYEQFARRRTYQRALTV
jgi:ribosomal protein S18 acetylase RimI-like enzyme